MGNFKGTKGKCYIERTSEENGDFQARILSNIGKVFHAGEEKDQVMIIVGEPSKRNGQANIHLKSNAELIVDAFNTVTECDLLPSQLLKQRNELLEALQSIATGEISGNEKNHKDTVYIMKQIAIEAIKKATE